MCVCLHSTLDIVSSELLIRIDESYHRLTDVHYLGIEVHDMTFHFPKSEMFIYKRPRLKLRSEMTLCG